MSTLKDVIESLQVLRLTPKIKKLVSIADELLGKYKEILPSGKTSTQLIQELRGTLYGKIKP
jgi:hypothetical protein